MVIRKTNVPIYISVNGYKVDSKKCTFEILETSQIQPIHQTSKTPVFALTRKAKATLTQTPSHPAIPSHSAATGGHSGPQETKYKEPCELSWDRDQRTILLRGPRTVKLFLRKSNSSTHSIILLYTRKK